MKAHIHIPPYPQWPKHGGVLWVTRDVLRQLVVSVDPGRAALTYESWHSVCRFALAHLSRIASDCRDHPLA